MIELSHRRVTTGDSRVILEKLDELIIKCYKGLLCQIEKNAKVGDFIKMFEMRMKLTPSDGERTKFWEMLEEVRQYALPPGKDKARKKGVGRSNRKTKK